VVSLKVDVLTEKVASKFVEKSDFLKYDTGLKKFCREEFLTNEIY